MGAGRHLVPECRQLPGKTPQMPTEVTGYQLPGVLDQHDVGTEQGRIVTDPADQAVAVIVPQMISGHRARESGARRACREYGRLPVADPHRAADLGRHGAGEISLYGPHPDVRRIGCVAAERARSSTGLAELCIRRPDQPESALSAESAAH